MLERENSIYLLKARLLNRSERIFSITLQPYVVANMYAMKIITFQPLGEGVEKTEVRITNVQRPGEKQNEGRVGRGFPSFLWCHEVLGCVERTL